MARETSTNGWEAALSGRLDRQRNAIAWLAAWCRAVPEVSSLSVGCSIGRGAADELSDVDAAIGVRTGAGSAGEQDIESVERALVAALPGAGELVDVLRSGSATTELVVRRVFAQFADGLQLDLAVIAESEVRHGEAAPDFVTVYRSAAAPERQAGRRGAHDVAPAQVFEWAFLGWRALLDADKYLQRGSLWEAHHRLNEARDHIWRLWAVAHGAAYPQHGLSQVLDESPGDLPPHIEATVAGLDAVALRAAVTAAAHVLDTCMEACRPHLPTEPAIAAYARTLLAQR